VQGHKKQVGALKPQVQRARHSCTGCLENSFSLQDRLKMLLHLPEIDVCT